MKQKLRTSSQHGFYLAFLAILLVAIIMLAVAVLGFSKMSTAHTAALNSANMAALAALEGFVNSPNPQNAYDARVGDGLNRAVAILSANKLPGTQISLSQLDFYPNAPGPNGQVYFGMWYPDQASAPVGQNPCNSNYPCFVPNSAPGNVNSVRVSLKTDPSNGVPFDLGNFIGASSFQLSADSYAAMVPRCAAYVPDISSSTQFQSHKPYVAAPPNPCVNSGWPPSSCNTAAYPGCCSNHSALCLQGSCDPKQLIDTPANSGVLTAINPNEFGLMALPAGNIEACGAPFSPFFYSAAESIYWCNYPQNRSAFNFDTSAGTPLGSTQHFRDDYTLDTVAGTQTYVDKYYEPPFNTGPQPFSDFFLGFNAGLRRMQATQSGTDQSMIYPFNSNAVNPVPTNGLTNDLGYLIQLTNLDNAGRIRFTNLGGGVWGNQADTNFPVIHPNYVDQGWYPTASTGNTNLVLSLLNVADALTTFCPSLSSKSIILATDGVGTCNITGGNPLNPPNCGSTWAFYFGSERQLLQTPISASYPEINQLLRSREIALTTIIDGQAVRPNFYNIQNPAVNCGTWVSGVGFTLNGTTPIDDPACYLTYEQARALGYGGSFVSSQSFDNSGNAVPDLTAFDEFQNGTPGWIFGRPVGTMMQMSSDTGGRFCPLQPPRGNNAAQYDAFYVDFYGDRGGVPCSADMFPNVPQCNKALYQCSACVLKSQYRPACNPGGGVSCLPSVHAQLEAVELKSKGLQSADCVRFAVGIQPYTLVSP